MPQPYTILGAGIAGLAAAWALRRRGLNPVVCEKDADWGGLCGNFTVGGFRFDRFVHFSFAPDAELAARFEASSPMFHHPPVSYNYYYGKWLRHPAQNNLAPLSEAEKVAAIADFVERPRMPEGGVGTYDEYLRCQFGNYFAEHFPFVYTRKYWGVEAGEMETGWAGIRMHFPDLREMLAGAFAEQPDNFYYTKSMNYPKRGGFRSILDSTRAGTDIRFGRRAVRIDPVGKEVEFADGGKVDYDVLISSLPLPEVVAMLPDVPREVQSAVSRLRWTCGYQLSFGFKRPDVAKYLWFYIYDEDVPPARVYSPGLKSPDNLRGGGGCSSLQAEVFFANGAPIPDAAEVLEKTERKLIEMGLFGADDVAVRDVRFEPYANVIFTPGIYDFRRTVLDYLARLGIVSIGRFGKWEYFWTHQAYLDAVDSVEALL